MSDADCTPDREPRSVAASTVECFEAASAWRCGCVQLRWRADLAISGAGRQVLDGAASSSAGCATTTTTAETTATKIRGRAEPTVSIGAYTHAATTRRGNPYKLLVNHCRINVRKNFFSERVIKVWNSLPPSIVSFESLLSFKNSLNNVNLRIYTTY